MNKVINKGLQINVSIASHVSSRGHVSIEITRFNVVKEHYENRPMQYLAIFHGCKNNNFQMKNCDSFLIFAQNIDCRYPLEPPH